MLHDAYSVKKKAILYVQRRWRLAKQFCTVNNTPGSWVSSFEAFWHCWPDWQTPKRKIDKIYPCYNIPGHCRFWCVKQPSSM